MPHSFSTSRTYVLLTTSMCVNTRPALPELRHKQARSSLPEGDVHGRVAAWAHERMPCYTTVYVRRPQACQGPSACISITAPRRYRRLPRENHRCGMGRKSVLKRNSSREVGTATSQRSSYTARSQPGRRDSIQHLSSAVAKVAPSQKLDTCGFTGGPIAWAGGTGASFGSSRRCSSPTPRGRRPHPDPIGPHPPPTALRPHWPRRRHRPRGGRAGGELGAGGRRRARDARFAARPLRGRHYGQTSPTSTPTTFSRPSRTSTTIH